MGFIAVLWLFLQGLKRSICCGCWENPSNCWQSLEGKLKTTFFLIWKYSAPQLICVFAPDVSFISYKARGNIRINESQYFYDVERFRWESPRLSRLQPLMAETAQSDLFWFWFFSPMLSEQKTPCKFWRAFSRMQRSLPWPRAFQRLQVNSLLLKTQRVSSAACQDFREFSPFPWQDVRKGCSAPSSLQVSTRCCFAQEWRGCQAWKIGALQPSVSHTWQILPENLNSSRIYSPGHSLPAFVRHSNSLPAAGRE